MNETQNPWSAPSKQPAPRPEDDEPTVIMDEGLQRLLRKSSIPPGKKQRPDLTEPPEAA